MGGLVGLTPQEWQDLEKMLNSQSWQVFKDFCTHKLVSCRRILATKNPLISDDQAEILRLQGQIRIFEAIANGNLEKEGSELFQFASKYE